MEPTEIEYGPEAQTDRDYESLTQKQKNTIEAILESEVDAANEEIAAIAGVSDSYVNYVEENFPHIVNRRRGTMQVAADGGDPHYEVSLASQDVWKAIRLLPDELSNKIFRQVRESDPEGPDLHG